MSNYVDDYSAVKKEDYSIESSKMYDRIIKNERVVWFLFNYVTKSMVMDKEELNKMTEMMKSLLYKEGICTSSAIFYEFIKQEKQYLTNAFNFYPTNTDSNDTFVTELHRKLKEKHALKDSIENELLEKDKQESFDTFFDGYLSKFSEHNINTEESSTKLISWIMQNWNHTLVNLLSS